MIKIFTSAFIMLFIWGEISAQEIPTKQNPSEEYIKEVVLFLSAIKSKELNDPSFSLVNTPKFSCVESIIGDSITFSKEELNQIKAETNSSKIESWGRVLSSKNRFLEQSFIDSVQKKIKIRKEVALFKKYFGGCYYNFSAPIFLRNYTICLFYADQICAAGESNGELRMYEKIDGVWMPLVARCGWIE